MKNDERGQKRAITLELNNTITNDPCAICGQLCDPDGFDFFLKGISSLVCDECASEHAPEMVRIKKDARSYTQNEVRAAFREIAELVKLVVNETDKKLDRMSQPVWEWPIEDVKAMPEEDYTDAYDELMEDVDYHTEAALLKAKREGSAEDVEKAEAIIEEMEKDRIAF